MIRSQHLVPFNRAYSVGTEHLYIQEALLRGHVSGDGDFTRRCRERLQESTGAAGVLLTTSCTSALEMGAMLMECGPGDEVIMPSYTFVSTANAFVLRGATPVFVDIRPDTLNLDERLVEAAVTPRTKAIVPVHYAGVSCDMEALGAIAHRHGLTVLEDAAQGAMATAGGRALGTLGDLGALSFHETKNITCGEGGALLVNRPDFLERAEILREKGTNRSRFMRGQVDKYTWVDVGSSYVLSDVNAAFLWAQLEHAETITSLRCSVWDRYHEAFEPLEQRGILRRPVVPPGLGHNAHMYYVLLSSEHERDAFLTASRAEGVDCVFHYVPLHSAPAGQRVGRAPAPLPVTDDLSARLVRLPIWAGMSDLMVDRVIAVTHSVLDAGGVPAGTRT